MKRPSLFLVMSEIWTMTDPRDLRRLVDLAVVAEKAGFAGVMIGEHIVLGQNAASNGIPANPRDWLGIANHPLKTSHPSSLPLLSAIAAETATLRLLAAALLTPLRHPLAVAKDLATVDLISRGRLTILPSVSWQREEYEALEIPFEKRGKILDEQLEIWERLWRDGSPLSHQGEHFRFNDVYAEPTPYLPSGVPMWFGGETLTPWMVRRTVRYGKGAWPLKPMSPEEMDILRHAMTAAGRDMDELELAALIFGRPFKGSDDLLDLDEALEPVSNLYASGVTTFLLRPSVFIDDADQLGDFCRTVLAKVDALTS